MGVHGLWKLLEPAGKIIPLESMAGQVLAVDVSIWLHQAIKGMHDSHGAPLAIAHLLLLFHRICKLLFYKIKPVFVFDGGVPILKREVMSSRGQIRSAARNEALKVRGKLLKNLLKHEAIRNMLSHGTSSDILGLNSFALPGTSQEEDLYKLPPIAENSNEDAFSSDDDISVEEEEMKFPDNIHSVDITSSDFKNLPPEIRHEILLELIETRKQSSWKHLDKMPKESDSFSDFQMSRLLKRRAVQSSLDEVSKEMGAKSMSLKDLESLLLDQRCLLDNDEILPSKRIAQNEHTRYIFLHKKNSIENTENLSESHIKDTEKRELSNFESDFQCSTVSDVKTSLKAVNITADAEETVEQGLTQHEIYNIIMKERECNKSESEISSKSTTLTKQVQLKLTDDIMEVLPLLGVKDYEIEKIRSSSDLVLSDISKYVKKEVTNEPQEKIEDLKEGNSNVESPKINEGGSNANEMSQNKSHELVNVSEPTHLLNNVENILWFSQSDKSYISSNDNCNKLLEKKCETNLFTASINKMGSDFIQSSEESDDDFESVVEGNTKHINNNEHVNMNAKSDNKIEIFVKVDENCESDDIFSDIFNYNSKTNAEKTREDLVEINTHLTEIVENKSDEKSFTTKSDMLRLQSSLENECNDLLKEQGKQERFAQNISEQMNLDAQELLRLFGVPYVIAPMEAEAQCAILNVLGLTDGTITDDSDIWLFGGKVVYKNFFNQKKHVLKYMAQDIEKTFQLCREDLIKMALLVGSDYTSGIGGVGPVTALEILGAFPSPKSEEILSGLKNFRNWISKECEMTPTMRSLRRKLKNIKLAPGFPSEAVLEAYLHPLVDHSKEPFSWAKPNVPLLQKYTKLKFGWTEKKCSELLMPVMKQLLDNKKNTTLEKYFNRLSNSSLLEGTISKRVENAIRQLKNGEYVLADVELDNDRLEKKKKVGNLLDKKLKSQNNKSQSKSKRVRQELDIPQKLTMEKVLEDRKRKAIQIFKKASHKRAKPKVKTVVKQEINLSESSSD